MTGTPVERRDSGMAARRAHCALVALMLLVALDLLWVLLTGASLVAPGRVVGGPGFGMRALVLALLLAVTFGPRLARAGSTGTARGLLSAALLASLCQFHFTGPRTVGDGMMYYVYVRSLWKDFDLNFANEYGHYGLLRPDRSDLTTPTSTGMRRSIFSIGPAILWTPFFGAGEAVARAQRLLGVDADLSGYGPIHWNAVALGSLLYGFGAVVLIHAFLRRHFGTALALAAALLIWGATFLHWYMVDQPTYAHAGSAFLAACAVWLWDRGRDERAPFGYLAWGLCLGLAMCVRWQNGLLLLLPGLELLARMRRRPQAWAGLARSGALLAAAVLIGAFPQMAAWKVIFGEWLLRYPPHGAGFVRLDHPYVLETLFSSRHGLLSWTPVLWLGFLGFAPALRRRLHVAAPLALALAAMTYVNACAGDWWAGASFSNRRFDSTLPMLAFGLAAALECLRRVSESRPLLAVVALLSPLVVWNVCDVVLARTGGLSRVEPVSLTDQVRLSAELVTRHVGSPPTWPASWVFALGRGGAPDKYDVVVGRYLFYRQNNLGGRIDIGERVGDEMLGEGWGAARVDSGVSLRAVGGRARLFAPLDVPEALTIRVRLRGPTVPPCALALRVNATDVGQVQASREWSTREYRTPRSAWRRETNDVWLETHGCGVEVDVLDFQREAAS
jgi:hypothetical protein